MKRTRWPRLIQPSTRAFAREARRVPGYTVFDWLHGYVYARWPYLYIGMAAGEHPLSRVLAWVARALAWALPVFRAGPAHPGRVTFVDTYHGKVMPLKTAKRLVTIREPIPLTDLQRVIPYARARDIVLENPERIVALDCPCRVSRPDPCLPLDVCLIVGDPLASFVVEHHPGRSRWISQQEAVEILTAENEGGARAPRFFQGRHAGAVLCHLQLLRLLLRGDAGAPERHAHASFVRLCQRGGRRAVRRLWPVRRSLPVRRHCPGRRPGRGGRGRLHGLRCVRLPVSARGLSLARDPAKGEPLEIQKLIAHTAQVTAR